MLTLATTLILRQDKFGKLPDGKRLERIKKSPNYRDGEFQNIHHTPALSEDASYYGVTGHVHKKFLCVRFLRNEHFASSEA